MSFAEGPMRVALFPTCVVDAVATGVGVSTVRVLRRAGCEVVVPEAATCCGQPAWNAGHADAAAQVARQTLAALADTDIDAVVVPAGSCATMMVVFWQELFHVAGTAEEVAAAKRLSERTWELSAFLAARGEETGLPEGACGGDPTPTLYHRSCHMLRELRITSQPEDLLDSAGVDRVEVADERCCGFGGMFSVKLPEVSTAMADDVLDAAVGAGAGRVVGCDTSCLLHLRGRAERRGMNLDFCHLAEILDSVPDGARPGDAHGAP